ncbi:hydantoinase/oxoprolinase family protein [Microbacterium sp. KR10-403]|uniref:hydantoinase/oxoprolinase family protein n=1 Tax=Microbacterium sp. KR10-403 TaxID=3158581 RepID=UPI0032E429B3
MQQSTSGSRVGIDVGGTFIDYAVVDVESGLVRFDKQPATAGRLHEEVMAGLGNLGLSGADIVQLFHGTTVAINALVQERGAKVALVTTAGFRDVLEIGRGGRPQIYNLRFAPTPPLVAREFRFEIAERLTASGDVLQPLTAGAVNELIEQLRESGADAVAICLLHAYSNPQHELALGDAIRNSLPGTRLTLSHQVASEWHEFERSSSAVINSYVQPLFADYLDRLQTALSDGGYHGPIGIMQSNGGVLSSDRAAALPVRTLMSGPAGGVVACRELSGEIGISHAICADVGGTTFDVALILDGELVEKSETAIGGRPVLGSMVDITSVGAGGGSIAWIDANGALKVGPESAGAVPGPVCFGKGGTKPTVTDAQVILGRLDPGRFFGGRMVLDIEGARRAIQTQVADPLGLALEQAALGILRIAETNMTNAIRAITIQRGLDPRDFALISYGGGGGLFATLLAEEMGVTTVVAPAAAANFSAWGILSSDYREDVVRTRIVALDTGASEIVAELRELADEVREAMSVYSDTRAVDVSFSVDARFVGQHHTVVVPVEADLVADEARLVDQIRAGFVRLHDRMYGPRTMEAKLEVVSLRAHGTVSVPKPRLEQLNGDGRAVQTSRRDVWFGDEPSSATIFRRADLGSGFEFSGPAVVDEATNTILVPPGWTGRIDQRGHVILTREGARA